MCVPGVPVPQGPIIHLSTVSKLDCVVTVRAAASASVMCDIPAIPERGNNRKKKEGEREREISL